MLILFSKKDLGFFEQILHFLSTDTLKFHLAHYTLTFSSNKLKHCLTAPCPQGLKGTLMFQALHGMGCLSLAALYSCQCVISSLDFKTVLWLQDVFASSVPPSDLPRVTVSWDEACIRWVDLLPKMVGKASLNCLMNMWSLSCKCSGSIMMLHCV